MSNKKKKPVDNETTVTRYGEEPGLGRGLWQQVRLIYYLMLDREVPIYLKLLPFLSVAYFLLPIDIIPDFVLGLGQIDDLALLFVGSKIFLELIPPHIVERHMRAIRERDGYLGDYYGQSPDDDLIDNENKNGIDPEVIEGIIIDDSHDN